MIENGENSVEELSKSAGSAAESGELTATLMAQLQDMGTGFIESLPRIGIAVVILLIVWGLVALTKRILDKTLGRSQIRRALVELIKTLSSVGIWILGLLVAMTVLFPSVKPSSILTALGLGGIAIGFAFKDIFENFIAGAMIMLRKPMRIGDLIECENIEGTIQEIHIRDTYVRQLDGQLILVPNSILFKNPVYIRTHEDIRRYEITAGVAYDVDVDQARSVIREAVESLDSVNGNRPIDVLVKEFNSSSVDFNVRWWAQSGARDMHESRDEVMSAIKRALDEAGIEIPFPYRTLTFKEPLPLARDAENHKESG